MLDPNALGTAFDIHWQLVHSVTFIEHFSGPQGSRTLFVAALHEQLSIFWLLFYVRGEVVTFFL